MTQHKKKRGYYWAVCKDFKYEVISLPRNELPDFQLYHRCRGGFVTLAKAKRMAREMIASDRSHFSEQLGRINKLKAAWTTIGYWENE